MNEAEGNPDAIWQAMLLAAESAEFDFFGHANRYTDRTEEEWSRLLKVLWDRNIALEINLNCLKHEAGIGIKKWLKMVVNGPFVIGWDFHNELTQGLFEKAAANLQLLQKAGVPMTRAITYREEGFLQWINTPRSLRGKL
jgi:hypothetical protein